MSAAAGNTAVVIAAQQRKRALEGEEETMTPYTHSDLQENWEISKESKLEDYCC